MTEITQETVAELTASIQKSNEATSQMIDLMGKIGERLDASEQRFVDLIDLLKDQRTKKPEASTSENNGNLLSGENSRTLRGAKVASVSSTGESQLGSGKSIQQQKHDYYIQEGKDVYQNIDSVYSTAVRCGTRHFFEEGPPNSASREEARSRTQKASQVYEHVSIYLHEKWFVGNCRGAGRALSTEGFRIGGQGGTYAEPDYDSILGCNRT